MSVIVWVTQSSVSRVCDYKKITSPYKFSNHKPELYLFAMSLTTSQVPFRHFWTSHWGFLIPSGTRPLWHRYVLLLVPTMGSALVACHGNAPSLGLVVPCEVTVKSTATLAALPCHHHLHHVPANTCTPKRKAIAWNPVSYHGRGFVQETEDREAYFLFRETTSN